MAIINLPLEHLEIFVVPIFMLIDYYATLWGFILYKKHYGKYVRLETYELNPLWQKNVDEIKFFSVKHLLNVVGISCFLLAIAHLSKMQILNKKIYDLALGMLIMQFAIVNGRHLTNILLFKYSLDNQNELTGEIFISHPMSLKISEYQVTGFLLPIIVIFIAMPSTFTFGCIVSTLIFILTHKSWRNKYLKDKKDKPQETNDDRNNV